MIGFRHGDASGELFGAVASRLPVNRQRHGIRLAVVNSITRACLLGLVSLWFVGCDRSIPGPPTPTATAERSLPKERERTPAPIPVPASAGESAEVVVSAPGGNPMSPASPSSSDDSPAQSPTQPTMSDDPSTLRMLGANALHAGDVDAAYRYARAAMSADSQDPQILFLMARVLGQRHRFPEAIRMLDRLAESVPTTRLPCLGQTAEWLMMQGDLQAAEQRFNAILEELPGTAMVHRELAKLMLRQGRRLDAARHLRLICQQGNIEEAELRMLLRVAYPFAGDATGPQFDSFSPIATARSEIGQGQWDAALATLTAARSEQPDPSSLLARVHAHQKNVSALQKWASDREPADPDDVDAWFALGTLEAVSGRHESAVRCFCEVVIRDWTDGLAYDAMSHSLAALKSPDSAAEAAARSELIQRTQAIAEAMSLSDAREPSKISELADLLEQLQRPDEALAWRAMQVVFSQATLSPEQMREQLAEINRRRLELLQAGSLDPDEDFLCCGVDLPGLRSKVGIVSLSRDPVPSGSLRNR